MHTWVKHKMVPVFREGKFDTAIAKGGLGSVWLGGLVNPQALFTALMQEKAVVSNCYIDEVCNLTEMLYINHKSIKVFQAYVPKITQ